MQVVMVISSFRPRIGGGEMQAERLASALVKRGHSVTVLTRRTHSESPEVEVVNGVEVVRVSGRTRWSYSVRMLEWIWKHRHRVDILHAHQANSPLIVGILAARLSGVPVVCTPMTLNPELNWLTDGGATLRQWLFRGTDLWIAKSAEIAQSLNAYVPGRVVSIPNGVDTDSYVPAVRDVRNDMPTVVVVGRLEQPKRVDLLLHAWSRLKGPARLLIVGDGSQRAELTELLAALKLVHVEFLGNRSDVPALLQMADMFVLASDSEGMPNALLEAMSCGLPCVASAVGAIPELMADDAGLLVPAGNSDAIATALTQLLNEPGRSEAMRVKARNRVVERYSLDSVAQRVEMAYHQAANMKPPA